jgi:L-ascorbate metabolism protein UlaG (beta-lactamase superfamily)
MFPEQSVQASLDLKAKLTVPIHWAKFDLALHKWNEPIIRFTKEAKNKGLKFATPLIGETFTLQNFTNNEWWNKKLKKKPWLTEIK